MLAGNQSFTLWPKGIKFIWKSNRTVSRQRNYLQLSVVSYTASKVPAYCKKCALQHPVSLTAPCTQSWAISLHIFWCIRRHAMNRRSYYAFQPKYFTMRNVISFFFKKSVHELVYRREVRGARWKRNWIASSVIRTSSWKGKKLRTRLLKSVRAPFSPGQCFQK